MLSNSSGTETLHYIGKTAEVSIKGSTTTTRLFIDDIAIISKTQQSGQSTASYAIRYTLRDRLGSVVSLTNEANTLSEHRSYDPFGKPRKGDYRQWSPATLTGVVGATPFTSRGYTDHEHLDGAQLIHMNGRVYDYNIGRFYSVDQVIQAPGNSQSLNPYSYIMNNPLAGTDPTGYTAECVEQCPEPSKRSEPKKRSGRSFVQDWYQYEKPNNGAAQNAKSTEPKTSAEEIGAQWLTVNSKINTALENLSANKYFDNLISDSSWGAWGSGVAGAALESTQGLSMASGRGAFLGIQVFGTTLGDFSLVRHPTSSSNVINRSLLSLDYSAYGRLLSASGAYGGLGLGVYLNYVAFEQEIISKNELYAKSSLDTAMLTVGTRGGLYGAVVALSYTAVDLTYGPQNGLPGVIALNRDLTQSGRNFIDGLKLTRTENRGAFSEAAVLYRNSPVDFMHRAFGITSTNFN